MSSSWSQIVWAQLWQVTLLVLAVALLSRLLAKNRPHLAYALWLVVLVKCLTPPLWSSPAGVFCWMSGVPGMEAANVVDTRSSPATPDVAIGHPRLASPAGSHLEQPMQPFPSEVVVVARPVDAVPHDVPARSEYEGAIHNQPSDWPRAVLVAVWASGLAVMAGVATLRWIGYLRLIAQCDCKAAEAHDRLVASLSRRLGLRRRVRLRVTGSRTGPAVVGLFRPTVLLPEVVVHGKSASDLEPMLAHELIHVRRGDLWVGVLQMAVRAVWWFHPLLWWALRLVTREAERCCDEEVVAGLGCKPEVYARSLLDVLKRKQSLQPVPAFPGVRPVEVTSRRLERIMRLGQGSHRRAPWWCWAAMLIGAAVVLPGAALVIARDEEKGSESRHARRVGYSLTVPDARAVDSGTPKPLPPAPDPFGARADRTAAPAIPAAPMADGQKRTVCVYRADDVLAKIRSDYRTDEDGAKQLLISYLASSSYSAGPPPSAKGADSRPTFKWFDENLMVEETERRHTRIAEALTIVRKHGLSQVVIEAAFLRGPSGAVEAITGDWTLVPMDLTAADGSSDSSLWRLETPHVKGTIDPSYDDPLGAFDRPLPEDGATQYSRARTVVEKRLPIGYQVISEAQAADLRARLVADRRVNLLQAPKMALFNGQTGLVSDTSQSPFVVGVVPGKNHEGRDLKQPQIRVVPEGLLMRLRPLLREGDSLWLDWQVTLSKIRDVDLTTFATGGREGSETLEGTTLQVPEVETTRLDASVEFPLGKTLLVGGLKTKDERGKVESLVILIRASKGAPNQALADDKDLYTRVYRVADLVVPIPSHKILVDMFGPDHAYVGTAEVPPGEAQADFASLVELIRSTVAPETWDKVGGKGTIRPLAANLSLVVSQTEEVHEEIVDLCEQLLRMQDVRTTLETLILDLPDDELDRIPVDLDSTSGQVLLDSRRVQEVMEAVKAAKGGNVLQAPKIELFNGQQAEISFSLRAEDGSKRRRELLLQSIIANDRRSVCLMTSAVKVDDDPVSSRVTCTSVVVPEGQGVLFDATAWLATDGPSRATPLLGTLPGLGRLFAKPPTRAASKRVFVLVTPTIVVQEEHEDPLAPAPRGT